MGEKEEVCNHQKNKNKEEENTDEDKDEGKNVSLNAADSGETDDIEETQEWDLDLEKGGDILCEAAQENAH